MLHWIGLHSALLLLTWGLGGALLAVVTLGLTLRRRLVPPGMFSALLALTLADYLIIPENYYYTVILQVLRVIVLFCAVDVLILSVSIRRRSPANAGESENRREIEPPVVQLPSD